MISILFIGAGTALAVFAMWAKTFGSKQKRVEKREKAEIIKQLLALSDRENSVSANSSPPSKNLRLAFTPGTRSDALQKATSRKHKPEQRYHRSPTPPLFHSDQIKPMRKSKRSPANAHMSCIKNVAEWMGTQQMSGCKQRRKC
jgi:hypothetical protein